MENRLIKLEFYIPETHLTEVKNALFNAGAGRVGNYDCCCWETSGKGQFRPCAGSNAFIGEINKLEIVAEVKVEMVCSGDKIKDVIQALKKAHPYETPAYQYWEIQTL